MVKVVGVRFKKAGKVYYFDPGNLDIKEGQNVIVETARGTEYGEIVVGIKEVMEDDVIQPLKQVIRIATEDDQKQMEENKRRAAKAFNIALEKIEKHQLPMKLIDSEYTFDDSKLIFYFTADGRVDFRELVKDLAAVFKTRIELRQIGVRDEAKMLGGLGPCGRSLCCATFLGEFEPVSIRMAKEQNLSLNPTKISGICGRLMCCLKFESDVYKEAKEELPSKGTIVKTEYGEAEVFDIDPLGGQVFVTVDDEEYILDKEEIEEIEHSKSSKSKSRKGNQKR
ncbi:MAG: stage 0 sporulation family protein [Firmicutes bacterium]|nr:stage 0 sporulation family protein [Bacillota bacterium]